MITYTATYSPDDNKLRLYASARLDRETYDRVKAAGFAWAPKQDLFVAPMWTPERADLCEELAGEIGDEDTSLTERAEQRAERFEDYREKRQADAETARAGVERITDGIPLGQPILVGHHSERHARKDAERIESGMRRAVKMWQTATYWTDRAAGAIRHAKYKERPDVRARRIKKLEADERKRVKYIEHAETCLKLWTKEGLTLEQARLFAGQANTGLRLLISAERPEGWTAYDVLRPDGERYAACPAGTVEQVQEAARRVYPRSIAHHTRWLEHFRWRLAYERAMLAESGGLVSDRRTFAVGGRVLRRGSWYVITKVNAGSVSVAGHFAATITHDEIKDYQEPTPEEQAKVAAATKLPPLCNYPGEGFLHMTRAELATRPERRWSDFQKIGVIKATDTIGAHRVQQARGSKAWDRVSVYVTDEKRKDPPSKQPDDERPALAPVRAPRPAPVAAPQPKHGDWDAAGNCLLCGEAGRCPANGPAVQGDIFAAMRDSLRAGVHVVSAPQLFPTPVALACQVVELAEIHDGHRVLEPSAGTGRLVDAVGIATDWTAPVVAVEIRQALFEGLRAKYRPDAVDVRGADFLACNGDLGTFDRIVMNPPFQNAEDVKHIKHALTLLKPGGRLVALCANGPRQRAALEPIATEWRDLPDGSFASEGTNVGAALVIIDAQ